MVIEKCVRGDDEELLAGRIRVSHQPYGKADAVRWGFLVMQHRRSEYRMTAGKTALTRMAIDDALGRSDHRKEESQSPAVLVNARAVVQFVKPDTCRICARRRISKANSPNEYLVVDTGLNAGKPEISTGHQQLNCQGARNEREAN